jgi:hypothetical protein
MWCQRMVPHNVNRLIGRNPEKPSEPTRSKGIGERKGDWDYGKGLFG